MKTTLFPLCLLLVSIQACQPDNTDMLKEASLDLPETPYQYETSFNNHIPTLGRVLFYDKQLSFNNSVSCSSCHKQALGFADDVAFSRGFEDKLTERNSMPIQNLNAQNFGSISLFWDGRETALPIMVLRPIANHVEMGMDDFDDLATRLAAVPYYRELFKNAYGTSEVTPEKIGEALSSFVSSINSRNTKFDRTMFGGETLTAIEQQGQQLFFEKYDCNSCHQVTDPQGYIFAGTFSNIGLDQESADKGLGNVTGQQWDNGKFKIPSLRNVALTGPYMHDGRFETLEDVIGHYSDGIKDNPNLDERLMVDGEPEVFNITEDETQALVAFLHTLTDYEMITNPKYATPFKTK